MQSRRREEPRQGATSIDLDDVENSTALELTVVVR
jgi:hypothetical protein